MLKLKNYLLVIYQKITGSIAFYPMLIVVVFIIGAITMLRTESLGISKSISEEVPYFIVNNADTARTILSTIIGGILSIMVFSFSMVMLLLNQASSQFSPRVLPSLIANKKHQFVLGVLIGTIAYCLIVIINILPNHRIYETPGVATFFGVILSFVCLGLFVYFLHSISRSIQIDVILNKIYQETRASIEKEQEFNKHRTIDIPNIDQWTTVYSDKTGYLKEISRDYLLELADTHETDIFITAEEGKFILKGDPVGKIKLNKKDEIFGGIRSCLRFSNSEYIHHNFVYGFKQITEIILKAMSPGINDPGTAITGIDYLSDLFRLRSTLENHQVYTSEDKKFSVYTKSTSFQNLFYYVTAPIRQYCSHDAIVISRAINIFSALLNQDNIKATHKEYVFEQIKYLEEDIQTNISNTRDRDKLEQIIKKLA